MANLVGDTRDTKAPVAVGGDILKHEGAEGIEGVVGVIDEAFERLGWPEGTTTVDISTRRSPTTGRMMVTLYNVTHITKDATHPS